MVGDKMVAADGGDSWSLVSGAEPVSKAVVKLARLGTSAAETRVRREWLDLLSLRPGEIVVDVGAGSGVITIDLARAVAPGGRVFAADPSAGLLDVARDAARDAGIGHLVDCRVADGRKLPFGPAAFDAAVCHWVLLHVDRPGEVIAEMKRVTRLGGRVLSVEMDWETAMIGPGDRRLTRRILNYAADRSLDPWTGRRLPRLFAAAGLADVAVHPIVLMDRGRDDRAWFDFARERGEIALAGGAVTREEVATWQDGLDVAFRTGTFFFAVVQFVVIGRVAD